MPLLSDSKIKKLQDKAYRDAYVRARVRIGIPYQIRALREQRGWSQSELGRRSRKPANVINRLENPASGGNTIRTCLEMASTFDVALLVKFVPYSRFLKEFEDVSPEALEVPSFPNDPYISGVYQAQQVSTYIVRPEPAEGLANALFALNVGQYINIGGTIKPLTPEPTWFTYIIEPKGAKYAQKEEINIPFARNFDLSAYNKFYLGASGRECGQRTSAD